MNEKDEIQKAFDNLLLTDLEENSIKKLLDVEFMKIRGAQDVDK